MRIDAEAVKKAAWGRWAWILEELAPELADAVTHPKKHRVCPFHGGKRDFRFTDRNGDGGAVCTCRRWGDGLALLQTARGWRFAEALAAVAEVLGLVPRGPGRPPPAPPAPPHETRSAQVRTRQKAREDLAARVRAQVEKARDGTPTGGEL